MTLSITSRPQFVGFRNAFYRHIQEQVRSAAYSHKVASISSSGKNGENRASEAAHHDDRVTRMKDDYETLKEISALATPEQKDFDRAAEICTNWGILQY